MANTMSAAKNARKAARRHELRVTVKSELKTYRKKVIGAIDTKQPADSVNQLLNDAVSKFGKAASNRHIHPKTAARKISRMMRAANKALKA